MRYIQLHHGSYWFQMRVPRTQRAKHGEVVRVNLQTADRDVARVLGTALAARWLARFSQLDLLPSLHPPAAVGDGALVGPALDVERTAVSRCPAQHGVVAAPEPVCDVQGRAQGAEVPEHDRLATLHEYWRDLTPGRPERSVVEFELTAHSFDKVIGVGISRMTRADVARYRDHLLSQGLQPATVIKRLGHLSAMVQTYVDAGRLERNVAQRMRVPRRDTTRTRLPFDDEQLRSVFASPVYTHRRRYTAGGGEAAAWLPPLALATGGRLEELGQLRVRDVRRHPTLGSLIHIVGDGVTTRVKTKGSNRIVPVHPELVRIGFLRYVDAMSRQGHSPEHAVGCPYREFHRTDQTLRCADDVCLACRAWLIDDRPALGRAASGTLKACFVLRRNSSSMLSVQWAEDTPSARKSLMTSDTRALSGTHRQA